MNFSHRTRTWRSLFQVCLVTLLLVTSAKLGFAQVRASIPSPERQKEIAKQLTDLHNLTRLETVAKKQGVVTELMEASRDENLLADERYVVLVTVIPLAKEVGDFDSWQEAVNSLLGTFEGDPQKDKQRLLTEFLVARKPGTSLSPKAVDEALDVARLAEAENRYTDAISLLNVVQTTVRRVMGQNNLRKDVTEVRDEIIAREKHWKEFQTANAKLNTDADDPAANFAVGRWHLLQQAGWKTALPFLIKASDAKWCAAAKLEETAPLDAAAQTAIGDEWWKIAEGESGAMKTALLLHAGEWYERAQPTLTATLTKQLVAKRLDEIAPLKAAAKAKPVGPVNPGPIPPAVAAAQPAKLGEWVDLLEWAEGVDWAPRGINWNDHVEGKPTKTGITLKRAQFMRFPLPAIIDGDYEMEVEFIRHDGNGGVATYFPVGTHTIFLELGGFSGSVSYIGFVNGKTFGEHRPGPISNNQRHRVFIRVRHDGDKAAFSIDLDNIQNYIKWEGATAALTNVDAGSWKTTMLRHPWIGSWDNNCEFHKVQVRMLSGTIHRDVVSDTDREEDMENGILRLVGEKANLPRVGWTRFLVNQLPLLAPPGDIERLWPQITRDFRVCDDFYGAHAPSRLKCPVPRGAKSFSVIGYNHSSRTTKYLIFTDGNKVHDSGITDLSIAKVDLPAKASLLELAVDPAGDNASDQAYWCYPRFHSVTSEQITNRMLDQKTGTLKFTVASSSVGAGSFTHNKPPSDVVKSVPIYFRDVQPCDEFLFSHAPSTVTYQVPEGMTRFTAIGYNVRSHHVKYEVWSDANRIYESPQAGIVPIDVKLPPGTKTIELKVNDLGSFNFDFSMWCYPRLHRK